MAIITDATGRQLAQAVGGIDTTGLVKDSTVQATNTELSNIDITGQSIASAITALGSTLGSDKANIDGSNIVNPSAFRQAIGLNKIIIGGVMPALALTNGNIRISMPINASYNTIAASKVSNIVMDIYGNISAGRVTATLNPRIITNIPILDFTPSVALSTYTASSQIFMIDVEAIELTLTNN